MLELQEFGRRLSMLRLKKGVSARDMSLSIGQSTSYLTNIENGLNWPSMPVFLCICEFLGISPSDFFNEADPHPSKTHELDELSAHLTELQIDTLITLAKELAK